MKIKDFTVGQVVYAFSYEDIALGIFVTPLKGDNNAKSA